MTTLICLFVADQHRGSAVYVEHDSVVQISAGDLTDRAADDVHIVVEGLGLQVHVSRRTTLVESGEQDAALQHKPISATGLGQPGQEALQDVELEQLVHGPPIRVRLVAQIVICAPCWRRTRRRAHSRTSSALRSAGSAPRKLCASSINWAGLLPGRWSQRRSASQAMSLPSR